MMSKSTSVLTKGRCCLSNCLIFLSDANRLKVRSRKRRRGMLGLGLRSCKLNWVSIWQAICSHSCEWLAVEDAVIPAVVLAVVLDVADPRVEHLVLGHLRIRAQIDRREAAPNGLLLGKLEQSPPDPGAAGLRAGGHGVDVEAVLGLVLNQHAFDARVPFRHPHTMLGDQAGVVEKHGAGRLADPRDVRPECRRHAFNGSHGVNGGGETKDGSRSLGHAV